MAEITVGSIVKINQQFLNETGGIDLNGMKAVVRLYFNAETEEECDQMLVEWMPETLAALPDAYFLNAFNEEVSWTTYLLPVNVVERCDEKADELELAWKKQEIFVRCFLSQLGREGKEIVKAFQKGADPKVMSPTMCWFEYLNSTLRFPVRAKTCYPYEEGDGPLKEGQKVSLVGLNGIDPNLGILADIESNGKSFVLPLQDLTGADSFIKDGRIIDAYGLWVVCTA